MELFYSTTITTFPCGRLNKYYEQDDLVTRLIIDIATGEIVAIHY